MPLQTLLSLQLTGWPVRVPLVQTSAVVHALLSLQAAVLLVCTHPFSGSQVSSVQGLLSSQLGGVPGVQLPPWQLSVQALPQLVPLRTGLRLQPPRGSQVSVVQGLFASQLRGVPAAQPVAGLQASVSLRAVVP